MPRFLDTSTGQFVWRDTGHGSTLKYAVLSHLWSTNEQSYHDVRRLQGEIARPRGGASAIHSLSQNGPRGVVAPSVLSHPRLSDKIKNMCRIARKAGLRLLWIDACCVDRSNNLELAETVHLTYELVQRAAVCYVYLRDVDDGPDLGHTRFRSSSWHTRTWTLQELIAPVSVVFLSRSWGVLGTKADLARCLENITGVHPEILSGRLSVNKISVAQRMSWAARRATTRAEDEAYALWGVFGVHMSPLYGEGRNAFLRLQEEIIKLIPDQSIFAWGPSRTISDSASTFPENAQCTREGACPPFTTCLLARSPKDFHHSSDIVPLSPSEFASRVGRTPEDIPVPKYVLTAEGILGQFICVDLTQVPVLRDTIVALVDDSDCHGCRSSGKADALALLQCTDDAGSLIALPICRSPSELGGSGHPVIATHISCGSPAHEPFRVVRLGKTATEAALQHLFPTPLEFNFLRQTHRPYAGSRTQQAFPGTADSTLLDNGLHFDLRHPDATSVPLASESFLYLRHLRLSVSPLCRKSSNGEIVLTTSMVSDFPRHSGVTDGQHIQLQVILVERASSSGRSSATFSVTNYIHAPAPEPVDETSPPGCGHPPRHVIKRTPCADGNTGTYTAEFDTQSLDRDSVLAEAEFRIYSGTHWETNPQTKRLIFRLTECQPVPDGPSDVGADAAPSPQVFAANLILSIELSKSDKTSVPDGVNGVGATVVCAQSTVLPQTPSSSYRRSSRRRASSLESAGWCKARSALQRYRFECQDSL